MDYLPDKGIIRIVDLATWLDVGKEAILKRLVQKQVHIIKMASYKSTWLVKIEDLK